MNSSLSSNSKLKRTFRIGPGPVSTPSTSASESMVATATNSSSNSSSSNSSSSSVSASVLTKTTCNALTKKGTPCRNPLYKGHQTCKRHMSLIAPPTSSASLASLASSIPSMNEGVETVKPPLLDIICQISDSFVHPLVKLAGGKSGHGERRLYTGDSNTTNEYLCTKPFKLAYSAKYLESISSLTADSSKYLKKDLKRKDQKNRKDLVLKAIQDCTSQNIRCREQNGGKDVRRYYIGPLESSKILWDTFRKTLIPKECSLLIKDAGEYFDCTVILNEDIPKITKSVSVSNSQIEYFHYLEKSLTIEICGGHNGDEFKLRNPDNGYYWPIDGYHNCELHKCAGSKETPCQWNNHVWEFQGDYFHGNPKFYKSDTNFHDKSYQEKWNKDKKKQEFYESQ